MRGEVGEADKLGKTKQEVAKINAATAVLETERKAEKAVADAKLTNREISIANELNIARINAKREAELRDAELNTEVEKKKAIMELERLRATKVVQAKIEKESSQQNADAALYAQEQAAEGRKFTEQAEAEAAAFRRTRDAQANYEAKKQEAEANFTVTQRNAEADYFRRERETQAQLITQQREAEGLSAMAKAYGEMAGVLGGPQGLVSSILSSLHARTRPISLEVPRDCFARGPHRYFQHRKGSNIAANCLVSLSLHLLTSNQMQYLMITNGTYERLADANAHAIKGLAPKINVWNTGAQGDSATDPTAPIRNLFQSLPPLLSTIHDQTGMQPPSWLAQMPANGANESFDAKKLGLKLRNGSESDV
jgi:flotillin